MRVPRIALLTATGVLIVLAIYRFVAAWFVGRWFGAGVDLGIYLDAAHRVLAGGSWYLPRQLGGPYEIEIGDVLYPPVLLILLVPFTVVPTILWWLIPLGIWVGGLVRLRPAMWAWPLMAICIWWPRTESQILFGNPVIWISAALWLGALWGWPSVFIALKPTVGIFALMGVWRRSWWIAAAMLLLVMLPFIAQYVTVLLDARSDQGILYSLEEWPMLLIPVFAWLGSRGRTPSVPLSAGGGAHADDTERPRPGPSVEG